MDLNDMLVFTKLVETKSFTLAADELKMPKSTVSRRVSQLEDSLGVRLVQRTTRRFSLTDIGLAYYQRCTSILANINAANQFVTDMQVAPRGRLRITAPTDMSARYLGQVLADFVAAHPEINIELHVTDRIVNLVEEGFDLAIRVANLTESSLVVTQLCEITGTLCASPGYLARVGTPAAIEDLYQHQLMLFMPEGSHSIRLTDGSSTHEMSPPARITSDHYAPIRDALMMDAGIGVMSDYSIRSELTSGLLVRVLPGWTAGRITVNAVYPARRNVPPRLSLFVEHLVREFNPAPWDRPTRRSSAEPTTVKQVQ